MGIVVVLFMACAGREYAASDDIVLVFEQYFAHVLSVPASAERVWKAVVLRSGRCRFAGITR